MNHEVIDQDDVLIDLDAVQDLLGALPATAELETATSTALAVPAEPLQLMYTQTLPSKVRDWYASGEGVIITASGVALGLASTTAYLMYLDLVAVSGSLALVVLLVCAPSIIRLLGRVAVVLRSLRGPKTVVVKGCAKGPTPGSIELKIPR